MKRKVIVLACLLLSLSFLASCTGFSLTKKDIVGEGETIETVFTDFDFSKVKVQNVTRKGAVNLKPVVVNIYESTEKKVVFTTQENLVEHVSFSCSSGTLLIRGKANEALQTDTLQIDIYGYALSNFDLANSKGDIEGSALTQIALLNLSGTSDMKLIGGIFEKLEISVSGSSEISIKNFTVQSLDLSISGASSLKSSDLIASSVKLDVSGTSIAKLESITSDANITLSGASTLKLVGSANDVYLVESGASTFNAEEMVIKKAELIVSGASNALVFVTDELSVKASSSSTVLYKGNPVEHFSSSGSSNIQKSPNLENE